VVYNNVAHQLDVTFLALGSVTSLTYFRDDLRRVDDDISKGNHCIEARRRFLSASFFLAKFKTFA